MPHEFLNVLHPSSNPIWRIASLGLVLFFFAFVSKRKHLLATLLRLEGLILIAFVLISYRTSTGENFHTFVLVFLTLVACEGALGLSLLILIVRNHGNDYFRLINTLNC